MTSREDGQTIEHDALGAAYPFPPVDVAIRAVKTRTDTHEEHVQCVGDVDNRSIRIICCCHFWHSRQNGSRRDWSQETAECHSSDYDHLSSFGEFVVNLI